MKKFLIILSLILTTTVCQARTPVYGHPHSNYSHGFNAGYNLGYNNGHNDHKETVYKAVGATFLIAVGVILIYNAVTDNNVDANRATHLTYQF